MTQDFKNKILNWLTANYSVNNGTNSPQYGPVSSRANNLLAYIQAQTTTGGFFISSILQGINANNQGVGFTIIAGYGDTTFKGFLIILDEDFDPIQTIKTYSNGAEFGRFEILNVGDDGNFFGIETVDPLGTATRRFVMLNNIIAKLPTDTNYKVVLRKSYNLPSNIKNATQYSNLMKAPSQAKYLIVGAIDNTSYQGQPIATELQVKVGLANVWTEYRYSGTDNYYPTDCLASWDKSGNISFTIAGFSYISGTYYCQYSKSGTTLARSRNNTALGMPNTLDAKILNATTAYVSAGIINGMDDETNYIYKVNYSNNTLTQIYSKTGPTVGIYNISGIKLQKFNNEIFYTVIMNKDTTLPPTHIRYIGRVIDTNAYEVLIGESPSELSIDLFMVQKQFNLYNFYYQFNNNVYTTTQVYNSINYNGLPYQALNSMVPNNVNIYDPNGVVIFARNLYNRIVNNNTTISTVEIPNDFMNDNTIELKELISETNNIMISDNMEIEKNIYEELLINFVNSIIVKNSNDINNIIINNKASNRINNSISNPLVLDYENSKIGKYKINYDNGTYTINPINTNLIYNGLSTNYIISVYVPLEYGITNIQLLSNDETTIYQTIDCSNLKNNKYYTINQKMEVV